MEILQAVWVFTFTATLLLDVDGGLVAGIAGSISAIVGRSIFSHSSILAPLPEGAAIVETAVYPMVIINTQEDMKLYNS